MKLEAIGFDVSASVISNQLRTSIATVQSRAVGTLARRLPVQARRDIQTEYNLKAGRISQGLSTRRVDNGVVLRASARGINLIAFAARWRKRSGVTAQVKKGGLPTVAKQAFIATGKNGNRLVFQRRGKSRLPIDALYGPSIGQMLKHGDRPQRLADFASGIVASELARLTR